MHLLYSLNSVFFIQIQRHIFQIQGFRYFAKICQILFIAKLHPKGSSNTSYNAMKIGHNIITYVITVSCQKYSLFTFFPYIFHIKPRFFKKYFEVIFYLIFMKFSLLNSEYYTVFLFICA